MKRFTGEIFWTKLADGTDIQGMSSGLVKRAILKDNVFKIDHENPEDLPNSEISLKSNNGLKFSGSAKYISSPKSNAIVDLEYYFNDDKALMLGTWKEEKVEFMCIIRLNEVESFQD